MFQVKYRPRVMFPSVVVTSVRVECFRSAHRKDRKFGPRRGQVGALLSKLTLCFRRFRHCLYCHYVSFNLFIHLILEMKPTFYFQLETIRFESKLSPIS